jgi:hypothetical protein
MRKCSITINDKEYTIELNRESVVWLESSGFDLTEFDKKPLTCIELLWTSGFIMNHSEVNPNLALKLMDTYKEEGGDVVEIAKFIMEEYQSFINALSVTNTKKKAKITED